MKNGLHLALDIIFDEDRHRYQDRVGAANLSLLRKVALAILSKDSSLKCGPASKQIWWVDRRDESELIERLIF